MPYTSSPGSNSVTFSPTASTVPDKLRPGLGALGRAEPEAHDPHQVGQAGHQMPGAPIHAGAMYPHQDLVVSRGGLLDLRQSEDVLG